LTVPTLPQALFLFLLGGVFLHFLLAGARTFQFEQGSDLEPAALISQITFVFGGTVTTWFLGLRHPIQLLNGIIAGVVLALSVSLYEWSRHTIWGRRFGLAWGVQVPEAVCDSGPYRFIRHPVYLSYLLAFLASLVAIPHWLSASIFVASVALFAHAAIDDERTLADSPLAADYAAYRERTGMFLPRLSRPAPGR